FDIKLDKIFCDMTNFFTYIASTNERCKIAQRGHNKQKRKDLRQFGLSLLASKDGPFPLFHDLYQGNLNDKTVFKERFQVFLQRLKILSGSLKKLTLVFDQGCNSKPMLEEVSRKIHFVGALSCSHHKKLITEANLNLKEEKIGKRKLNLFRAKKEIWGKVFSVVVYVSPKLRAGQIRGLEKNLQKIEMEFDSLQEVLLTPVKRGKQRTQEGIEKKITSIMKRHKIPKGIIRWNLNEGSPGCFYFKYWISSSKLRDFKKNHCGRRILITNRHNWGNEEIIKTYWGKSNAEQIFKTIKNPFFLALRPQFHWTDQKIRVHAFICVLACLLATGALKEAEKFGYKVSLIELMENLSSIRLATLMEKQEKGKKGRFKLVYRLEEMESQLQKLANTFSISENTINSNIPLSVY
ncbi:MAG: IS1634 family transposase, partial [Candidatus Riflebacteria bacterium]|nr:IS1634 family transposase [Candidatus Riflebacteria bacterium]